MHLTPKQYQHICNHCRSAILDLSIQGVNISLVDGVLVLKCEQGTLLHSKKIRELVYRRNGRLTIDPWDFVIEALYEHCDRILPEMGFCLDLWDTADEFTWKSTSGLGVSSFYNFESRDFHLRIGFDDKESHLRWEQVFEQFPTADDLRVTIRGVKRDLVLRHRFKEYLNRNGVRVDENKDYQAQNCFSIGPVVVFIFKGKFSLLVPEETADLQKVRSVIDLIHYFKADPQNLEVQEEKETLSSNLQLV